jgi:acetyl esterase/lipase
MRSLRKLMCASLLLTALGNVGNFRAQTNPGSSASILPLWPGAAPLARGDQDVDQPTLTVYLAAKETNTSAAVVVCPGGGYMNLAMDHEGIQVARWLNGFGVNAFVLKYRVGKWDGSGYRHPVPLLDAQRALRTVRSRAKEWGIDPGKIGIMGFSAGGHLASTVGTHFDGGSLEAADLVERVSCRPNFMILIYPVISLRTEYAHRGSRNALLGPDPDLKLVESLSNETQVTTLTPPTFMIYSDDDPVLPENSVLFYLALRKAKVPAELHIFGHGGHGYGLAPKDPTLSGWPKLCEAWLRKQGMLGK